MVFTYLIPSSTQNMHICWDNVTIPLFKIHIFITLQSIVVKFIIFIITIITAIWL
jgi:hypothetical protein